MFSQAQSCLQLVLCNLSWFPTRFCFCVAGATQHPHMSHAALPHTTWSQTRTHTHTGTVATRTHTHTTSSRTHTHTCTNHNHTHSRANYRRCYHTESCRACSTLSHPGARTTLPHKTVTCSNILGCFLLLTCLTYCTWWKKLASVLNRFLTLTKYKADART